MLCNLCYKPIILKGLGNTRYEPRPDKNVIKMVCGNCVQKLLTMKVSKVPEREDLASKPIVKQETERPILRRRRH